MAYILSTIDERLIIYLRSLYLLESQAQVSKGLEIACIFAAEIYSNAQNFLVHINLILTLIAIMTKALSLFVHIQLGWIGYNRAG